MKPLVLAAIRAYQRAISWWMPPVCRFYPSCSKYTAEAVAIWGPSRGLWLGVQRIFRCGPWHPGGLDPVPRPEEPDAPDSCACHAGTP
ncbi:MAG: membrane protein insertion efficiency factor YidD [Myxococcales bacterium]|nr:membrane protein insertion efficiency factor YidD [Myxococcales bacterium]